MYAATEENKFIEVTYANGEKEVLYFKDFASGALIEGIVSRAKKFAVKRAIAKEGAGLRSEDLIRAIREEFKEHEDLPNTTNPDDWAKVAGKKGEKIVHLRTISGGPRASRARSKPSTPATISSVTPMQEPTSPRIASRARHGNRIWHCVKRSFCGGPCARTPSPSSDIIQACRLQGRLGLRERKSPRWMRVDLKSMVSGNGPILTIIGS